MHQQLKICHVCWRYVHICRHRNLESNVLIMNRELEYVSQWMIDNRLTINAKKSNYVIFSRAKRKLEKETFVIHLSGSRLAKVKETKYLGVKLDENLMWIPQVNSVVSKVSKYVPIIYNLRNQLNNMSLRLLYNSLVYPNIVYCNSVWGLPMPLLWDLWSWCKRRS